MNHLSFAFLPFYLILAVLEIGTVLDSFSCHKKCQVLGDFNNKCLFFGVLEAGSHRSRCQQEVFWGGQSPGSQTAAFSLHVHMTFPQWTHVERDLSSSYEATPHL